MKVVRLAMLLLVQLSLVFAHVNGEDVYKCAEKQVRNAIVTVTKAGAQLTNGCVLEGKSRIAFDLKAMYTAVTKIPKKPVVIDISYSAFINSYIMLFNAGDIPEGINNAVPLLFTMSNSKMNGESKLVFGDEDDMFKLPPHSRLSITHSELTISATDNNKYVFTFYGLQLDTSSSMEIAHNIIAVENKNKCDTMVVFYIPGGTETMVAKGSSFIIHDNKITMDGRTGSVIYQNVWYQEQYSPLTISDSSTYTWSSNNISMTAYDGIKIINQNVWYQGSTSPTTISQNSKYTWISNIIRMVGNRFNRLVNQFVMEQESPLTISERSMYTWTLNTISVEVHGASQVRQNAWYTDSAITISVLSHLLFHSNKMVMLVGYRTTTTALESYVMTIDSGNRGAISGGSSMVWRGNCVAMGHKKTDKRYVFNGKWSITGEDSEMLLDGNYFTITNEYGDSGSGLTEFMWGTAEDTDITIDNGALTIKNIKVHANSAASGATNSMLWYVSLYTSKASVKQPNMEWSSSPAKDGSGLSIPTINNNNIRQYMCVSMPKTPTPTPTPTPTFTVSLTTIVPKTPTPTIPQPTTPVPTSVVLKPPTAIVVKPSTATEPNSGNAAPSTADGTVPTKPSKATVTPTVIVPVLPVVPIPNTDDTDPKLPTDAKPTTSVPTTAPKPNNGYNVPKPPATSDGTVTKHNGTTVDTTVNSATAVLCTIPGVLITSVVFLYLYN